MKLVLTEPLSAIFARYPISADFFQNLRLSELDRCKPLMQALEVADEEILAEFGVDGEKILAELIEFLEVFGGRQGEELKVSSITVVGGRDKSGADELGAWTASVGETVSIVGPTGSGKSRLLGDIECLADRDTPTGRRVLIDGIQPTAHMSASPVVLIALSADKRIVVRNGGVVNIIETGEEEKRCLHEIERLDATLGRLRSSLRQGEEIKLDDVLRP